jgi:long-chain acyl-CoA synthetase
LVSFDKFEEDVRADAKDAGVKLFHIDEVRDAGKKANEKEKIVFKEPTAETVCMFCYTSGTTGDPKAAKLTHKNLLAAATSCKYGGIDVTPEDCYISYLPLAHSFEKCLFVMALIRGIKIGFYAGDVLKLAEDCEVLRPTLFPSVPRLFCRIYDKITSRLKELTGMKAYLANRAISSKLYYLEH